MAPKRQQYKSMREWLVATIKKYGGPPDCTDDYVLRDNVLKMVSAHAVIDFGGVLVAHNGTKFVDFLHMLEDKFPDKFVKGN